MEKNAGGSIRYYLAVSAEYKNDLARISNAGVMPLPEPALQQRDQRIFTVYQFEVGDHDRQKPQTQIGR